MKEAIFLVLFAFALSGCASVKKTVAMGDTVKLQNKKGAVVECESSMKMGAERVKMEKEKLDACVKKYEKAGYKQVQ